MNRMPPSEMFLPFKDQKSAFGVRHQLGDLSRKINANVQSVHARGLCDTDICGLHKSTPSTSTWNDISGLTIGDHVKDEHGKDPETIGSDFGILKKMFRVNSTA